MYFVIPHLPAYRTRQKRSLPLFLACAPFVSPNTMGNYIEQKSGADPLAIHICDTDRWIRPKSEADAIAAAKKLLEGGMTIEAGLAQINSAEWKNRLSS